MDMDRRDFLRGAVGTGCALAFGLRFFHFSDDPVAHAAEVEQLIRSTCSPNCTGACGFKARVTKGRISTLIQAADAGWENGGIDPLRVFA